MVAASSSGSEEFDLEMMMEPEYSIADLTLLMAVDFVVLFVRWRVTK